MRVVHLATELGGGAGLATLRLHRGLRDLGVDSRVITLRPPASTDPWISFVTRPLDRLTQRLADQLFERRGVALFARQRNRRVLRKLGGTYEVFTFPESPYRLDRHPWVRDADIVHLHWVGNLVDYPTFFSGVPRATPIVWTLHDMNPFLGGFHYQGDFDRNPSMQSLDLSLRQVKRRAYGARSLRIVAPSRWMRELADGSDLLAGHPSHHIANGVDTTVFKFGDQPTARARLGLPSDVIIVLFVSATVTVHRKGMDLLRDAMGLLGPRAERSLFVALGSPANAPKTDRLRLVGRVESPEQLAAYYQAADLLVLPSREDNLPNVMVEALACGLPVVAFSVGGITETLAADNAVLVPTVSAEALAAALDTRLSTASTVFDRRAISQAAHQRFDQTRQARRMQQLYTDAYQSVGA